MSRPVENLKGVRFGKLVCLEHLFVEPRHRSCWFCKCDCGKTTIVRTDQLKKKVRSCGCGIIEHAKTGNNPRKHGLRNHRLYYIYHGMKDRCYKQTSPAYQNYGARGIQICEEWKKDFMCFYNWAIRNGYKQGLTIDRIDVNGNYCPQNCRWATRLEQARNTRTNRKITYKGKTRCVSEWAQLLGIKSSTITERLKKGWPIDKVLKNKRKNYAQRYKQ